MVFVDWIIYPAHNRSISIRHFFDAHDQILKHAEARGLRCAFLTPINSPMIFILFNPK